MSYRLIDANGLNGVISNDDYEKVLNAPCIFADLPNGLDGEHYNLQESVDKIRAEIEGLPYALITLRYISRDKVIEILDKYKADKEQE